MLQEMRKYAKSWVASLFLGLLALSFGVWGIADIFRGSTETNVATVGGEKIPADLFQRDFRNVTREASQRGALSPGQARLYGQQTLDNLVDQVAIDQYAQKYGITVTDATVSARVRAIPNFVGQLGTFDHNTFLRLISQVGFTEEGFIEYVRGAMEREQFLGAAGEGLALPPGYARAFFNYLNEVRAVEYIALPSSAAGPAPTPTDAQLNDYLQAHKAQFSTPEYREVTFAWISPEDLASKMTVTDQQLKQQYELEKAKYVIPDRRTLEQITYPGLVAAKAAKAKADSGTSFADLAKQRGVSATDIQIGALSKDELADRGSAVFALPQGGVSQPLKAPVGYALIHVVSITPGKSRSFDEVKDELHKQLAAQLAGAKIADIGNQYIDENSRGEPLPKAAAKAGMQVGRIDAIDAKGNTPNGSKAQIPSDPELLAQIFKADVGEDGDPFQSKSGTTYVVKVDGVRPPKLKSLSEVRAEVMAAWQKERIAKQLETKAKALAEQATARRDLKPIAASVRTAMQTSSPLRRPAANQSVTGAFSRALLEKIFSVPAGNAVYGIAPNGAYVVARVTGVLHPPAMVLSGPRLRQFALQVGRQAGQDLGSAATAAARVKEGVTINKPLVDRLSGAGA
jgi:peptidyl-prolyl cis-trans isomerase D